MSALPLDASTRYCAVYGHPVSHSASPAMHNAAIEALGLNWRYLAFDVHPGYLREAIEGARRMKFIGLNLTVPHKLLALEMMDELDDSARSWGAVNTVRFEARGEKGTWMPFSRLKSVPEQIRAHGFNTDADAVARSLREDLGMELNGAAVLLLGAGGAGRVAALKLAAEKVKQLYLVNRTVSKAEAVAADVRKRFPGVVVTIGYPAGDVDLVLNATSLGLKPKDQLPFEQSRFKLSQARFAYDMIYRPAETPFLKMAKATGCRVANGIGMLLYQGAAAFELWSGQKAPIQIMRSALIKNVYG